MKWIVIVVLCLPLGATTTYIAQSSGNVTCNGVSHAAVAAPQSISASAGDTVYLSGTITSATQGGTVLTISGTGTSGSVITVSSCAEGTTLNSSGWWGNYNNSFCTSCTGAISVASGASYVVIDGLGVGTIQNIFAGTSGGSCFGGSCSQQPGTSGSLGIHSAGDNIIIRNWTIQNIYTNGGASSGATDTGGINTADIRIDGGTNIQIYNNVLDDARAGIWSATNGSGGANGCSAAGVCYYSNQICDHGWEILANTTSAGNSVINIYGNTIGDIGTCSGWLNWQYPTSTYHQDGVFLWGTNGNILTANVWNNQIAGDLGQGSPSGMVYCTNDGTSSDGTGCTLVAWNNVIAGTGSSATNDQMFAVGLAAGDPVSITLYNNTMIGGAYSLEVYNGSGGTFPYVSQNNIFSPGSSGNTRWYIHQENGGNIFTSVSSNNNLYFNGNNLAWNYQGTGYGTLSNWQSVCSCDALALVASPNINQVSYVPNSGSVVIGLGANLTSIGLTSLDSDKAASVRPATGSWTAGAYNTFNTLNTVAPSGLFATLTRHQFNATWKQSSSPVLYNTLMCGKKSGGPYSTFEYQSKSPVTSFSKNNVSGKYCCVVTATGPHGTSPYSNESCVEN